MFYERPHLMSCRPGDIWACSHAWDRLGDLETFVTPSFRFGVFLNAFNERYCCFIDRGCLGMLPAWDRRGDLETFVTPSFGFGVLLNARTLVTSCGRGCLQLPFAGTFRSSTGLLASRSRGFDFDAFSWSPHTLITESTPDTLDGFPSRVWRRCATRAHNLLKNGKSMSKRQFATYEVTAILR